MIEMVDNHAHNLLADYRQCSLIDFAKPYCESRFDEMLTRHIPLSLFYQHLIRKLLSRYRCPTLADYLELRLEQDQSEHLSGLFSDAGIETVLVDDGYHGQGETLSAQNLSRLAQVKTARVLRIETILENLTRECTSLDQVLKTLPEVLNQELSADQSFPVVALKTIVAYRGGLQLDSVSLSTARSSFHPARKEVLEGGRINRSATYHYLLSEVLDFAVARQLPVQVHCGLGDDDALLSQANPVHFQALLKAERYRDLKCVFLHCYPYVREVAYLASIYPGVFFDLSLANSLIAPDLTRIYYEALSAAPVSKILAGTDGHSQPESYWYGAMCLRRSLTEALKELVERDYMLKGQQVEVERAILRSNAISLYKLNVTSSLSAATSQQVK